MNKLINKTEILYFPCTYVSLLSPIKCMKENFMVRFYNLETHGKIKSLAFFRVVQYVM
jgi:hypothetical protein